MDEEVEYVGLREDFLSEDDHSPTDASEDSVEVKVTPIKVQHYRHHPLTTRPKAGGGVAPPLDAHHQLKVPQIHRLSSVSPPIHKFYHNIRKHFPAGVVVPKEEYDLKTLRSPPPVEEYESEGYHPLRSHHQSSPQDFSRTRSCSPPPAPHFEREVKPSPQDLVNAIRNSPGVISPPLVPAVVRPCPSTSPVEPPMGAAPLSPGTRAAARSRRKPTEPRRLCHEGNNINHNNNNNKRCHSPEPPRKPVKLARTESNIIHDDKSVGSSPSPGAPPLFTHHPLLGPLARPPLGAFPPLLLPPAWPPVATQWGYPRVVTPLGWAGLTPGLTPHPYPMLLPHHYPLSRPLLHPHLHPTAGLAAASPPPAKSPPPRPPSEEPLHHQVRDDLPLRLVTRIPHPEPPPSTSSTSPSPSSTTHHHHHPTHPLPHPHHHPHHLHPHYPPSSTREVSVVKKIGKTPSKFLSVESLIASDSSPSILRPEASVSAAPSIPTLSDATEDDMQTGSLAGDEDDTIHSLLQTGKQKQRNYKNMTRERRIEANARERNRVHTISAAFEKLRTSVPAYSHNQKLSKLSVLRIACSYILTLSRMAGEDYSEGSTEPSVRDCVDLTTRTIQVEGKAKKKRDE